MISIATLKYFFYDFVGYNRSIFLLVHNSINSELFQYALKYISYIFNISNFAVYYFISTIIFIWISYKEKISKEQFLHTYNYFVKIGMSYALIGFTYAALKFGINLPRPFCNEAGNMIHTIMDISKERCLSSFPSAHTAISILILYAMWGFANFFEKLGLVTMVIIVMISRLVLAMHYPADLLYSIIIVAFLISSSNEIYNLLKHNIILWVGEYIFNKFLLNAKHLKS